MGYDFNEFKKTGEAIVDWLKKEYSGIRTSQANPSVLDSVQVEVYGSRMPINQVASILGSGPKSLLITPWDLAVAPNIDKAIRESNLGLSVSLDAQGVRVFFPELTSERRLVLVKLVKEKLENARVTLRSAREKCLDDIEGKEKDGSLSEDDKFRCKGELQKLVDLVKDKLEDLAYKKEKEMSE